MATNTPRIKIPKPIGTDAFNRTNYNLMIDAIEANAASVSDVNTLSTNTTNSLNNKLDKTSYTAADVLAKLKTVDGAGSGVDADLLDGKDSSEFSLATHNHDSSYLKLTGGTISGRATFNGGVYMGGGLVEQQAYDATYGTGKIQQWYNALTKQYKLYFKDLAGTNLTGGVLDILGGINTSEGITSGGTVSAVSFTEGGTALSSKYAASARKVSAGTGLTGGGDLTADRSLAVSFGGNGAATSASRSDHSHTLAGAGITDVTIATPVANQHLRYDGTKWVNAAPVVSDNSDVAITSATNGHVLQYDGTKWVNKTAASAGLATSSRKVNSGTGITGGGDLSADRTLAFDTTFGDGRYINMSGAQNVAALLTFAGTQTFTGANELIAVKGIADSPSYIGFYDKASASRTAYIGYSSTDGNFIVKALNDGMLNLMGGTVKANGKDILTVDGGTVGQLVTTSQFQTKNGNDSALIYHDFINGIAGVRYTNTGGFQIRGVGDDVKASVDDTGLLTTKYGVRLGASNYWQTNGQFGMDAQNSDIINLNGLFFADSANATSEGLNWLKSIGTPGSQNSADYDNLRVLDGVLYLNSNPLTDDTIAINKGTKNFYVSNSGNDSTGDGTKAKPWKTIQKAVNMIPNIHMDNYNIRMAAGQYPEEVYVKGLVGGQVQFFMDGTPLKATDGAALTLSVLSFLVEDCTCYIRISDVDFYNSNTIASDGVIKFARCSYGAVSNCRLDSDVKTNNISSILFDASKGSVISCYFTNQYICVRGQYGADVMYGDTNKGSATNTYALSAVAATIYKYGVTGFTPTNSDVKSLGGQIFS